IASFLEKTAMASRASLKRFDGVYLAWLIDQKRKYEIFSIHQQSAEWSLRYRQVTEYGGSVDDFAPEQLVQMRKLLTLKEETYLSHRHCPTLPVWGLRREHTLFLQRNIPLDDGLRLISRALTKCSIPISILTMLSTYRLASKHYWKSR